MTIVNGITVPGQRTAHPKNSGGVIKPRKFVCDELLLCAKITFSVPPVQVTVLTLYAPGGHQFCHAHLIVIAQRVYPSAQKCTEFVQRNQEHLLQISTESATSTISVLKTLFA